MSSKVNKGLQKKISKRRVAFLKWPSYQCSEMCERVKDYIRRKAQQ